MGTLVGLAVSRCGGRIPADLYCDEDCDFFQDKEKQQGKIRKLIGQRGAECTSLIFIAKNVDIYYPTVMYDMS